MSLAILFHLCAQHVSDINISITRSLRLFCWITTLVVLFLVRCVLEFRCGWFGVVSVLQASACNTDTDVHKNMMTGQNLFICLDLIAIGLNNPACDCFLTKFAYREGLLALRPNPKLEDHPSSAVRDCLLNLFAATLLIGGRSSIRNLRTRHAVVTGIHWIGLAQDRDRWQMLVKSVMNLRVPWNAENFLTSFKPVSFSRMTLHHGVSK